MPAGRPATHDRTFLGERLSAARQKAGLTQDQLAERLRVTQRVVSYWERRPVALRAEQIAQLAEALGVSTDYLIGREATAAKQRASGPVGKVRRLFDAVSGLPRHHQEKLAAVIEAFVAQHGNDRATNAHSRR